MDVGSPQNQDFSFKLFESLCEFHSFGFSAEASREMACFLSDHMQQSEYIRDTTIDFHRIVKGFNREFVKCCQNFFQMVVDDNEVLRLINAGYFCAAIYLIVTATIEDFSIVEQQFSFLPRAVRYYFLQLLNSENETVLSYFTYCFPNQPEINRKISALKSWLKTSDLTSTFSPMVNVSSSK